MPPSYTEQERQWRDEQLNWLHEQHEVLLEQVELMRQQNATQQRIARHTGLMYVLTIIWLVLGALWLLFVLIQAASNS